MGLGLQVQGGNVEIWQIFRTGLLEQDHSAARIRAGFSIAPKYCPVWLPSI